MFMAIAIHRNGDMTLGPDLKGSTGLGLEQCKTRPIHLQRYLLGCPAFQVRKMDYC